MHEPLLDLLHEDDDLLVVNKPAGLVVHPGKAGELSSLIGRVRLHLGHGEGRLVNRLDRETTGIVLIAKHASAARDLGRLIAARGIEKAYEAIVHGRLDAPITIDAPIGRDEASAVAIKDAVRPDGAAAVTRVAPVRTFQRNGLWMSHVDVRPETGRKHQIRIHLAHAGHAIVGDKIYGGDETIYLRFIVDALTPNDVAQLVVPHHALHAGRMAFEWSGRRYAFAAPASDTFRNLLGCTREVPHA
jgi:23S rRNA pseudouridine1911/1915/1917 synthase